MDAAVHSQVTICLERVTKVFGRRQGDLTALEPITLSVVEGEFLVLVGPSGCGKTTLLNLIAGFEAPSSGRVYLDGHELKAPGPDRMMLFQESALFPWLDVLDNVAFGLRRNRELSASQRADIAANYLRMVHLSGFEHAHVHELSGGMKQRVALARALAPNPRVLLCDEPFASLDALTRERLYAQVQEIQTETGKTIVFITHNVREAACLGDRVIVLSGRPGQIRKEVIVALPRPRSFYDSHVSEIAGGLLAELQRSSLLGEEQTP
jgi:NitT/TauT family transport system ATP-binding protein